MRIFAHTIIVNSITLEDSSQTCTWNIYYEVAKLTCMFVHNTNYCNSFIHVMVTIVFAGGQSIYL